MHGHEDTPASPGSLISPVLFAIYIAEIHEVEKQVERCRGISFVDGVTWLSGGDRIDEAVRRLERCAAASPE